MINFTVEEKGGILVIKIIGRLDAVASPSLEKKIAEFSSSQIILDFSEVD